MQQSAAAASSPTSPSFMGLLAALAEPETKFPPARDDDGLADDIATLSYENALRTHARYRPAADEPLPSTAAQPVGLHPAKPQMDVPMAAASLLPQPDRNAATAADSNRVSGTREQVLKRASVTIRLNESECAQLRQRAAEAGLTISAYMRSCTFEAENLRALVKDTLAQLRSATSAPVATAQVAAAPPARAKSSWWRRAGQLAFQWDKRA
jgi:hypothetical protein